MEVAGISEQGRCGDIEATENLQGGKEYKNIGARRHGSHSGLQEKLGRRGEGPARLVVGVYSVLTHGLFLRQTRRNDLTNVA